MSMLDIFDIGPNKRVGISINERDLSLHDLLRQYSNLKSEADNICAFDIFGDYPIPLKLLGEGKVHIVDDSGADIFIELVKDRYYETQLKFTGDARTIFINGLENVTELYIDANYTKGIAFTPNNTITKLSVMGRELENIDIEKLSNLRVLHIPYTKLTSDDFAMNDSELNAKLDALIDSLPNRADSRHGSIVLYPYYGLEVLLFNDKTKYPTGETITLNPDKIYGLIQCNKSEWDNMTTRQRINTDIVYYRSGADQSYVEQLNFGNSLRKKYEPKLFSKNWFVGSAIEYHEDWELCYWPFRQLGIHEIWESAQKGFGITYATVDSFSNKRLPLWEDFNGHGLFNMLADVDAEPTNYAGRPQDYHGDALHQYVAGRAQRIPNKYNLNMGLAPNIASYFFSYSSGYTSLKDYATIKFITEHCDVYSSSYSGYSGNPSTAYSETNSTPAWLINYQLYRRCLNEWAESNFACVSAGNSGDDNPGTLDDTQRRGKNIRMGYYNKGFTDDEIKSLNLSADDPFGSSNNAIHSKCFSVNSMMQNDISDPYSTTAALSMWESKQLYSDYTDALSMYGCQTPQYYAVNDCWYSATGTSNASPACAMVVGCLMRILYTKMFPDYSETAIYDAISLGSITSYKYVDGGFGKGTKFMDYVNSHWMNKLPDQMTYQVGLGMPTFNCEPESRDIKYIYTEEGFGDKSFGNNPWFPINPPIPDEDKQSINLLDKIYLNPPIQEMGISPETRKPPNTIVFAQTEINNGQLLKSQSTLDVCQQTYAKKKDGSIVLINTDKLKQGDDFVNSPSSIARPLVKKPYIYWNSNSPTKHKGPDQFKQNAIDLLSIENSLYKYADDLFTQTIDNPIPSKIVIGNDYNELFYHAIENEDGANINSLDWTIQIPFSVELLFKDVLANKATVDRYDTVFPFVQFSDDSEQGMLFSAHRFKINWDATTNRYWIGQSSRPFALQPKSFTKFVTSDNGLVDLSKSVYSTYTNTNMSGHNLEFEETLVITFVQKSKDKCIEIYYNGTYMSTFYLFDVDKLFRLTDAMFVKPNVIGHPLVYDHNLTEDEIIYNTAYLKQFRSNLEY